MSRATGRSRKVIEGRKPAQTVIWCDDPADVPATIDQMLRAGELRPEDIHTCVHWTKAHAPAGAHERALAELEAHEQGQDAAARGNCQGTTGGHVKRLRSAPCR